MVGSLVFIEIEFHKTALVKIEQIPNSVKVHGDNQRDVKYEPH
jgi:hypothetical protein